MNKMSGTSSLAEYPVINSDCFWRNSKFVAALQIVRIKSDSTLERIELQP